MAKNNCLKCYNVLCIGFDPVFVMHCNFFKHWAEVNDCPKRIGFAKYRHVINETIEIVREIYRGKFK